MCWVNMLLYRVLSYCELKWTVITSLANAKAVQEISPLLSLYHMDRSFHYHNDFLIMYH